MSAEPAQTLALGTLLGRGGMGTVHEASQPALGRTLAVKRVRDDRAGPEPVRALLAEARVTGAVAHPNVVPVHDVRIGDTGRPEILLKRIQGQAWSRLLRDPAAVARLFGATEVLAFHVGVLEQVCAAVHAAHARGIVHRDLKPGNVMVGRHGEVYLLDWGLGVTLRDDADPRLPRVSDHSGAGTPQYMAPEMVSDRYGRLGPWSDVYLLGGLLFHVLFGRPPHHGDNVWNLVVEACRTGVEVPDDGPAPLVDLCRRCLARRPEDRLQDAEQVRRALRQWLDHRPAVALADEASLQALHVRELIAAESAGQREADPRLHAAFGAAVFAWQQALALWPGHAQARHDLDALVREMAEHALERGRPGEAEAALAVVSEPPTDVAERVAHANAPLTRGAMPWIVGGGAAGMAARGIGLVVAQALGTLEASTLLGLDVIAFALALIGLGFGSRRPLRPMEHRAAAFAVLVMLALTLVDAGIVRAGLPVEAGIALHPAMTAVAVTLGILAFRRRYLVSAGLLALASAVALLAPDVGPIVTLPAYLALGLQLLSATRDDPASALEPAKR